jgi:hypothetical protein
LSTARMGNVPTVHFSIQGLATFAALLETDFTVVRSRKGDQDEWEQSGWRIQAAPHCCVAKVSDFARAARSTGGGHLYKLFMTNTLEDPNTHACGWRRIGTFWPTDMPAEARSAWFADLAQQIKMLEDKCEDDAFMSETERQAMANIAAAEEAADKPKSA